MRQWLVIEPLDTVSVRDGRAFDAGTHSTARTVVPHPGTVAGAVGAAFRARPGAGTDPAERGRSVPERLHGPVVVQRRSDRWRALFAAPRSMVRDGDTWTRLSPCGQDWSGVRHDQGGLVLLGGGDGDSGGWVSGPSLRRFLHDPAAVATADPAPWTIERRVGLAREDDRTARDGMLYAAEHLRPLVADGVDAVGFAVGCIAAPRTDLAGTVFFGGEGRRAAVHAWEDAGDVGPLPPRPSEPFDDGRLAMYLATPAALSWGWRPADAELRGASLVAAAVGDPQVVAMARPERRSGGLTHRRLLWCAPAGSVYFLKFANPADAAAAATAWHGQCLTQTDETLRTAGFGLALTGRW